MKCVGGIWYYRGQCYATLHEAIVAAWPRRCHEREKRSRPGVGAPRRQGGTGLTHTVSASHNITGTEVFQA